MELEHYQPADGLKRVTVSCATLLERVRGEVAKRKNVKKKPIVGDGQRLHTAIRCFTQGISMLINQYVDL